LTAVSSGRFYSLDVLRGVAALTVVFWHWQHFFLFGPSAAPVPAAIQPLYSIFFPFYGAGWIAVDLFFALSGFIFFWLYGDGIAERRVTARDFFVRRVSRLYPLHLATLLAVAAGQEIFRRMSGAAFVYQQNDATQFRLNAGLVHSWVAHPVFAFNAPSWSISVEAALYIMFFVVCRVVRPRVPVLVALAAAGLFLVPQSFQPVGRGMVGFFLGGCVFLVYRWIVSRGYERWLTAWLPLGVGALWVVTFVRMRSALARTPMPWRFDQLGDYWPAVVVLFPLTILALVLVETRRGSLGRRVALLGDLSYSSYLLHFPLQLGVAIVALSFGVPRAVFLSPWTLLGFFALVLAVSLASHRLFEVPAQRWLRERLTTRAVAERAGR
jgi:peptidoglycan/LPS O-acetylase OafA/YrhL